jgi:hypothetical protein
MQALNHEIATKLREIAQLLRAQQANPFRVNAYLHAADTLDNLLRNVAEILQAKGIKGLAALPSIGAGIARSIYEYVATGRMSRLENLRGAADPVELFRSIPARWKCLSLSLLGSACPCRYSVTGVGQARPLDFGEQGFYACPACRNGVRIDNESARTTMIRIGGFGEAGSIFAAALARAGAAVDSYDRL